MALVAIWTHTPRESLLSMGLAEFERWYDVLVRMYNKLNQPPKNG